MPLPPGYRDRFPGVAGDWARFDGPAGTQMVDVAIDATAAFSRSGSNANSHGFFDAARAVDELMARARTTVAALIGADPGGVVFGPSTTNVLFGLTRAIGRGLRAGDEIVVTQLDHDANVTPWRLAAADSGASVVTAKIDAVTGTLPVDAVASLLTARTRWVAVTGASNAIGTVPDVAAIADAAHKAGARLLVDAVHLAPHRAIDVGALGCDALVTSAYKWYGPHGAALWIEPSLLESLEPYRVRPAPATGPGKFETGTPAFETLAGVEAAARFLQDVGLDAIRAAEEALFAPLLEGLQWTDGVEIYGLPSLDGRTPTVSFNVGDLHPDDVARALARDRIAVWSGNYYAVEIMAALGLDARGGAVRAGVSSYNTRDDVDRLLASVRTLAQS
ncbi:MAG: cysteine desulfurase-like protein [Actinobacteria bacterium]|nr:cysteine desulfurase-like protein [Actinomycetota bacterium]